MEIRELSFDLFEKYQTIADWINSHRVDGASFRILDVGGRGDFLQRFLPADEIFVLDCEQVSDDSNFILGDATDMPFADGEFDFVVSSDVLEHIEQPKRKAFVTEHVRCAKKGAMFVAPFHLSSAPDSEEAVNRNYRLLSGGEDYRWLTEHKVFGLPNPAEIEGHLQDSGIEYRAVPLGYLPLWNFMLNLSHLVVFFNWQSAEVYQQFNRLNRFFNEMIAPFDRSAEATENYRMAFYMEKETVASPEADRQAGTIRDIPMDVWHEFSQLYWELTVCLMQYKEQQAGQAEELIRSAESQFEAIHQELQVSQQQVQELQEQLLEREERLHAVSTELLEKKGELEQRVRQEELMAEKLQQQEILNEENRREIEEKEQALLEQEREIERLRNQLTQKEHELHHAYSLAHVYENSTSWKVTKPLRSLGAMARHTKAMPKRLAKYARDKQRYLAARKIFSLRDILKLPELASYETISFDMFDTLVFRKVDPPEIIHRHVAQYIAGLMVQEGLWNAHHDHVLNVRYDKERELRHREFQGGGDYECCMTDLIFETLTALGGKEFAERYADQVKAYEMKSELAVLYSNPEALDTLKALKEQGKKVVIVSDMYLELDQLHKILEQCGLLSWIDEVYVSNQYGLCKGSGRLFEQLLADKVLDDKTLHTGDNYVSDYKMPREKGVSAVWYVSKTNDKRRKKIRSSIEQGSLTEFMESLLGPDSESNDPLYRIGKRLVGPLFTLYLENMIQTARERKVDEIFFLAREGYLFIRMYEQLKKMRKYETADLPEGKYTYISRLSSSLPSVYRFGFREVRMGLWKISQKGLHSILSTFNLKPETFELFAKDYGFYNMKEPIWDPYNDIRLHNFIDDYRVQELIHVQKEEERELLHDYFEQLGFFGADKKCIFVDIGWSGTIQHNITRAFISEEDFPTLYGVYFGRNVDHHLRYLHHPKMVFEAGFAFDFEKPSVAESDYIMDFPQLFEQAATAPHGSTIGYRREADGTVVPVLKGEADADHSHEKEQADVIRRIQAGIMAFVTEYCEVNDFLPVDPIRARELVLKDVIEFIKHPRLEDVRAIEQLYHSEDWGTSNMLKIVSPHVSTRSVFRPKLVKREVRESFWRQGTIRKLRVPGLLGAYDRIRNRKKRKQ